MRSLSCWMISLFLALSVSAAAEDVVESRVSYASLFKNGLALVRREVTLPRAGDFQLDASPQAVHGTLWVEGPYDLVVRMEERDVAAPASLAVDGLRKSLAGRKVMVRVVQEDGAGVFAGTVIPPEEETKGPVWNRQYEASNHYGYQWARSSRGGRAPQASNEPYLPLRTAAGETYVSISRIISIQAEGAPVQVRRPQPVLLLSVPPTASLPAKVHISYLTKGLSWAPSYRVDLLDDKTLTIAQKAVIRNEVADLDGTEVELISGFPNIRFSHVSALTAPSTTWTQFFQQLQANPRQGGGYSSRQQVMAQSFNRRPSYASEIDFSAVAQGEGVDLHYQPFGTIDLKEGGVLSRNVARGKADYERMVEWVIPDERDERGRRRLHNRDNDEDEGGTWDVIRFRNPFKFPMTTAAASVYTDKRFNGQQLSHWVDSGEHTVLRITKALSIRTAHSEQEEQLERKIVYVGGNDFRESVVKGELRLGNHRAETVRVRVRRCFSGELLEATGEPKNRLLPEGVYSVNKRHELLWSVELKPGEEKTLTYRHKLLVDH